MSDKQICLRCLAFAEHCDCEQGPRTQRHPASCGCSMCETGRAIVSGALPDEEDEEEQS